jgi:predicted RNA-binding protein with PUA-like domain
MGAKKKRSKIEDGRSKKAGAKKPVAKKKAAKFVAPTMVPQSAPYAEGKWAEAFAPRKPGEVRYWLVKSEPSVFSFDDLLRAPTRTTYWDGVRNFAARNFLRDGMKLGDRVFFYHSMADPQVIAGIVEVVREGYPDVTALDPKHVHFDAESNPAAPIWFMVDLRAVAQFTRPVTLPEIKARKELADMALIRIGRLSVTPVRTKEWETILKMAE